MLFKRENWTFYFLPIGNIVTIAVGEAALNKQPAYESNKDNTT
jgi:hypothetical protein